MKKLLTLLLAMFYMGSSTGATFHMHYCMEKLVDIQLWHGETEKCGKCEAKHAHNKQCNKKCCKDEHKTVKLEKDQKVAENTVHLMQLVAVTIPVAFPVLQDIQAVSLTAAFPVSNAPPRSSKVSPQILHCTFRI